MNYAHALLFCAVAFAAPAWAQSPPLLLDFSRVQHKPSEVTNAANQPRSVVQPSGDARLFAAGKGNGDGAAEPREPKSGAGHYVFEPKRRASAAFWLAWSL